LTLNFILGHGMPVPSSKLGKGSSAPNPRLGKDAPNPNSGKGASLLNSKLGRDASAPNPMLGQERVCGQLHIGLWCVRAQPHVRSGTRSQRTPRRAIVCPSLTILGCSQKLTRFFLGSVYKLNQTPFKFSV
jgi:hypothetical protein